MRINVEKKASPSRANAVKERPAKTANEILQKQSDNASKEHAISGTAGSGYDQFHIPASPRLQKARTTGAENVHEVIQRYMGMEIETKIPVEDDKGVIADYPRIADHSLYHIDIDHSKGKSILEFVMHHFDEHAGTEKDAFQEFDQRLALIVGFIDAAIQSNDEMLLSSIAMNGLTIGKNYQGLKLKKGKASKEELMKGPIHFTSGFALKAIPALVNDLLAKEGSAKKGTPRKRAAQSIAIDDSNWKPPAKQGAVDIEKIKGFIAILYMQIAAVMDGKTSDDSNLLKNKTQALSRVPMNTIFGDLTKEEQGWLTDNKDEILRSIQIRYSGRAGTWASKTKEAQWNEKIRLAQSKEKKSLEKDLKKWLEKSAVLVSPLIRKMVNGAFGVTGDNPADTFGKMTVIANNEPVGPDKEKGYALELRRLEVIEGDPQNWQQVGHSLISFSRKANDIKKTAGGLQQPGEKSKPGGLNLSVDNMVTASVSGLGTDKKEPRKILPHDESEYGRVIKENQRTLSNPEMLKDNAGAAYKEYPLTDMQIAALKGKSILPTIPDGDCSINALLDSMGKRDTDARLVRAEIANLALARKIVDEEQARKITEPGNMDHSDIMLLYAAIYLEVKVIVIKGDGKPMEPLGESSKNGILTIFHVDKGAGHFYGTK